MHWKSCSLRSLQNLNEIPHKINQSLRKALIHKLISNLVAFLPFTSPPIGISIDFKTQVSTPLPFSYIPFGWWQSNSSVVEQCFAQTVVLHIFVLFFFCMDSLFFHYGWHHCSGHWIFYELFYSPCLLNLKIYELHNFFH